MKKHKIRGFSDVLIAEDYGQGISSLIQTSGLGGLRHNSVVVAWPDLWDKTNSLDEAIRFSNTIRQISANKCAILVPKNLHDFPNSNEKVF